MTKSIKKFKKNDWDDEQEQAYVPSNNVDKRKVRRIDRALKTKDISTLLEDEESLDYLYDEDY